MLKMEKFVSTINSSVCSHQSIKITASIEVDR